MKRIIAENTDGRAIVIIPSTEALEFMTIEEIALKDVPNGLTYEIVDTAVIPSDRTFRNAWVTKTGGIKTDMPKAKEIAHTKRRADRDELFKPLDIQATIPSQAIVAEQARQNIRDADAIKQASIDNANTTEELKVILGIA